MIAKNCSFDAARESVYLLHDFAQNLRQRRARLDLRHHARRVPVFQSQAARAASWSAPRHRPRSTKSPSTAACPDPASSSAAPYPGKPKCTPCTACSSRECRAVSRAAPRTSKPCPPSPPQSCPSPTAASPADCIHSSSGTPHRMSQCCRSARAALVLAGTGVERHPVPHDPPAVASSRIGISA
jgi:hypothetical protein